MSTEWMPPPGNYISGQILPSGDENTNQQNFQVFMQAFGLFGGAGARYVSPNMRFPTPGTAVQWLIQAQGFYNYTAGADVSSYPGVPVTFIQFPQPFPAGGGVSFIRVKMRYAHSSGANLTYGVQNQVGIVDDSIDLTQFAVVTVNVHTPAILSSGAFSLSYIALGWVPVL